MALIQITDVDAGVTSVTASITNDAGLVWLPALSAMGAFTSDSAAAIVLMESPAASRRFSATVPLPAGVYSVTYKAGGEVVGDREVTVGSTSGSVNVTLSPVYNSPVGPLYEGGEISVYQGTSGSIVLPINDASGPVTLSPSPMFTVYRDTTPAIQVWFQVVAAVSGNNATVSYSSSNSAVSGRVRYELRATNGDVLATGQFTIKRVP